MTARKIPSMRPFSAIILYLTTIFLGAALIAPWVYSATQSLSVSWPFLNGLAHQPFHRYVSRCLLIIALAGLAPFVRALGVRDWKTLGLGRSNTSVRDLRAGLAIGFISLALLAGTILAFGGRVFDLNHTSSQVLRHLVNALGAAVVVSTLEEVLFRGAIFGGLRRSLGWRNALLASSVVFALVHFLERSGSPEKVVWTSGFLVLGQMLSGFARFQQFIPGFFNLFLAGGILCLVCQRRETLYGAIGIHAGWIFWLKSYGFFTTPAAGANTWWWGSAKMIDGWGGCFFLGFLGFLIWRFTPGVNQDRVGGGTDA